MLFLASCRLLSFPLDQWNILPANGQGGVFAGRPKPSHDGEDAGRAKREDQAKQQPDAALGIRR
ncbi:hypothetical protein Pan216_46570 [Planctomycetes bacterium Pan216]|uniref:Uncharacterized protein n=1 Tax=Kolteria novifilia TaxID=2527975 RepID=A0A518B9W4_9BACT|nr:hypothetical protein Pan216_35520 [Planctomycetes bacterium Pan216]QDU63776.1 hypothetical protein Pan216_46570 [Planctomycetes bacterium Pan216]